VGLRPKHKEVVSNKAYHEGRIDIRRIGLTLGWYYRKDDGVKRRYPIINAGMIHVGITSHVLGLCIGRRDIFIGRDGLLWKYPKVLLNHTVPTAHDLNKEDLQAWADACARSVIDRITPNSEATVTERSNRRYRKIIRALVEQRILDAASLGYERNARSYARCISSSWTDQDLLNTRHATIRHATLVSLALALEADKAAQLIELAALIEMRVPFVSREAALSIYQQSVSLLARLCPQWWNQGHLCDWNMVGDIDRLFRAQYVRMIEDAWDNGTQFETMGGLALRKLVGDPFAEEQEGEE